MQEFNKDRQTLGFIYKLEQNSIFTEYYCDDNQTYSIKSHSGFFTWGELFTLLVMYVGTRFLSIIPLDEILLQSILGKNIRCHQPFDYDESITLSVNDPRPVMDQAVQNVLTHWIPRFIVDALVDLVICGNARMHTLTYKDPESILDPLLATHLEKQYSMTQKPRDHAGQTKFFHYRHLVEEEHLGEETLDFISFSLPSGTFISCLLIIHEGIEIAMKFPSIEKYETFSRFIANDEYITMSIHPVKTDDEDTNNSDSDNDNDEDEYIQNSKKVIMHRQI